MKKIAFTLSEILISLTVIGIIAAITIPALITNYQKAQTIEQLKESYSILNSALISAREQNGNDINAWYVPNTSSAAASTYFAETYIIPYIKTINVCGTSTSAACRFDDGYLRNGTYPTNSYMTISGAPWGYSFTMPNGTIALIYLQTPGGTTVKESRAQVYFDINGKKKPNIMGKDGFLLELGGWVADKNKLFQPYAYSPSSTRVNYFGNTIEGGDINGCNKIYGNGTRCFALILHDGWKISDDYPW